MKNKKLEEMLGELVIKGKIVSLKREKITTTIDKDSMDDFRELCGALEKNINIGFDSMLYLIMNNEEFLKSFLKDIKRR